MHILLFLLLFLAAIVIFGLSIVGFVLRAIFGLGRGSSSRTKQARSGQNGQQQGRPSYNQNTDSRADNEGKSLLKTVQEPNIRKYSLRMTVNMWISRK